MTSPDRPSPTRTAALTVGTPLALLVAAGVIVSSWSARLPSPVAVHWGLMGVDGTASSLTGLLVAVLGTAAALSALVAATAVLGSPPPFTRRMAAATSVWSAAFLGGVLVALTWSQLDLADAHDARLPAGGLAIVTAASVLLALGAAALTPGDPAHAVAGPIPADARRTAVRADERVVWTGSVRSVATDALSAAWVALTVVATVLAGRAAVLALLVVPVALVLLGGWRVTIDRSGIWARGLLGVPRTGLALDQVVRADVTAIRPLREFGGFGVRSNLHGHYGLVLRKGEAIVVQRAGGGVFVATVDGARAGAALLNGLAERGREK